MTGVPFSLTAWAIRHGVTLAALAELRTLVWEEAAPVLAASPPKGYSDDEAYVQSEVRLEAARVGARLFRNNVGVLEDTRGVPVRYGLANDSAAMNERLKSSDLVGWKPVTITPEHVGRVIGQAVMRECKHRGWVYRGTDREQAQWRFIQLAQNDGCDAAFTTGPGSL